MSKFFTKVHINPIIAAVNDMRQLDDAIQSPSEIIFLLTGNILNVREVVRKVKKQDKSIFIHIDLMDGLGQDAFSLRYIHDQVQPDGIISTKPNLIRHAKDMKMFAIQRLFILDSLSLETGIKSIKRTMPDAVEILPGVMPKITKHILRETRSPIITGGLIKDKEDVIENLKAGAIGISTSSKDIWGM